MCNVIVANAIIEILDQMKLNGQVFTAFDVTIAVRAISSDSVVHNDVRNIIQNEYITQQMAGYDRELCALDISGNPQALVYFPDTKQATDHPLVSGSSLPSTDNDTVDTSAVDLDNDEYKTTKEGRVQIPRKLVSQVTPSAGSYDILIDNNTNVYRNCDARGDIRVGLRQFGITDDKVRITVDTSNNTINIDTV